MVAAPLSSHGRVNSQGQESCPSSARRNECTKRSMVVAEELNFTRAAARLGMAQPPLSAAIGKLERKLGVRLLERTSRRVTLTPAGAVLLEQGRIAAEGVGAAIQRARRKGTQADRLTVAVKPGTGPDLLKKIMQAYARDRRMPQVHILFGHPGGPAAAVAAGPPTSRSCAPRSTSAAWTPNCC